MAKRRRDTDETGPSGVARFVDAIAAERYRKEFSKRKYVPERGFSINWKNFPTLHKQKNQLDWDKFCRMPGQGVLELAREFYSNLREKDAPKYVMVRGIQILISSRALNDLLKTPHHAKCEFQEMMDERIEDDEIIRGTCVRGAQWQVSSQGVRTMKKTSLLPAARVWLYFINYRLLPSLHFSTVSYDRMVLLYCILKGHDINVGKIIRKGMMEVARNKKNGLWFPSIITSLYAQAGGEVEMNEQTVMKGVLSRDIVIRLLQEEPKPDLAREKRRNQPGATSSTAATPSITLESIHAQLNDMLKYQVAVNVAYFENFKALAAHLQMNIDTLKPLPEFTFPTSANRTELHAEDAYDTDEAPEGDEESEEAVGDGKDTEDED